MSKAIQCDRCYKCFSPADMKKDETFISMNYIRERNNEDYVGGCITVNHLSGAGTDVLDFCPECSKIFLQFLYPKEEHYYEAEEDEEC